LNKIRFREIDDSNRGDYQFLKKDDNCLFLFEYTSGSHFSGGQTNQLIADLSISPRSRFKPEYARKQAALRKCCAHLHNAINWAEIGKMTFVPAPPQREPGDPDYDDYITRICRNIHPDADLDIRDLIIKSRPEPVSEEPLLPDILRNILIINQEVLNPIPKQIVIVDDVLKTGSHFRVMHDLLRLEFPETPIYGIFIARRIVSQIEIH
jgi:hypothetical protein